MTKKHKPKKAKSTWAIKLIIVSLIFLFLGILTIASYKKGHSDGVRSATIKHEQAQEQQKKLLAEIKEIATPENDLVGKLQDVLKQEQSKEPVDPKHEFDSNTLGHPPVGPKRVVTKKPIYSGATSIRNSTSRLKQSMT